MREELILQPIDLAAKFKSKTEFYNLLRMRWDLSSIQTGLDSWSSLKIVNRRNLFIICNKVEVIKVPRYNGLQDRELLKFASFKVNIQDYLSDYQNNKKSNKEWICNLINTLIPKEFHEFIQEKVEKRRDELIESQNLGIKVKPEFADLIVKSNAVSIMKGKSHF